MSCIPPLHLEKSTIGRTSGLQLWLLCLLILTYMSLSRSTAAHSFTNPQRFCEIEEIYHILFGLPHTNVNMTRQKSIDVLYLRGNRRIEASMYRQNRLLSNSPQSWRELLEMLTERPGERQR